MIYNYRGKTLGPNMFALLVSIFFLPTHDTKGPAAGKTMVIPRHNQQNHGKSNFEYSIPVSQPDSHIRIQHPVGCFSPIGTPEFASRRGSKSEKLESEFSNPLGL